MRRLAEMAFNALFWIQIGCAIGGMVCAILAYHFRTKFYEGFDFLKKAHDAEGPEKERLILKSIEVTGKQMTAKGLTSEGRAQLLNILGLAYRFLSEIRNESANLDLAVKAYREAVELTDRKKLRDEYVKRRTTLGETYREMAKDGRDDKNLALALVEFQEAHAAADTSELAEKRADLEKDIAGTHLALAKARKDTFHASEAIRLLKNRLAAIDPQKEPVQRHLMLMALANAFACASDIDRPVENLRLAVGHCDLALAAREHIDRKFSDMANESIASAGNSKVRKAIDDLHSMRALSDFKLLSLFSTLHMRLADLEDREGHLDSALWAVSEVEKIRTLREDPGLSKATQKWKGTIERMRAGESFGQVSGKDGDRSELGYIDGEDGSPA